MPGFVKTQRDEEVWQKAKDIAKKADLKPKKGRTKTQTFWAFTNSLFHKMKNEVHASEQEPYLTDFKTWFDNHPDILKRIPKNKFDTTKEKGGKITVWGAPKDHNYTRV